MANRVLKTKSPALLIEEHRVPTVLESCKERTYEDFSVGGITQLSPRLELVLSLLKKTTTSSPCSAFTSCDSRSLAAFHHTLSCVMPDTDVRPFLTVAPVSTAPTLSIRSSPLLSLPPHPCVNIMHLPGQWDEYHRDWLCILCSCGSMVPWPGAILHHIDVLVFHRLYTSVSCGRRWLLSCGSSNQFSQIWRGCFSHEYFLLQAKGEVWWFRQVLRKYFC